MNAVFDMVIVKVVNEDIGRIVTPEYQEARRDKCARQLGIVISIGPDFKDNNLKKGDTLYYQHNEGYKIEYKGEEYMAIRNRWCHAKERK